MSHLEKMGFKSGFFRGISDAMNGLDVARVVAVHKDRFTINNGERDIPAELVGKLAYGAESPLDLPTVGDWVAAGVYDDGTFAVIHHVLPRQSVLKRKTPGKKIEFQLIAANIDTAFIVQSLDHDFNLNRLERYLVMVHGGNIAPMVLLSKSDLATEDDITEKVNGIQGVMPDLGVIPFSNKQTPGLGRVRELLAPGMTYCLLGSSGVGKTTLLNNLMGEAAFKTRAVREKDGKGRHATTHRQLIMLDSGAMIIDTPGMRELGHFSVEDGLNDTFSEISELSHTCRFNDCTHTAENGCSVLEAVESGRLSEKRYRNYIKMHRESMFNELSYYEKRSRDKEFGKLVKRVMQHKKGDAPWK